MFHGQQQQVFTLPEPPGARGQHRQRRRHDPGDVAQQRVHRRPTGHPDLAGAVFRQQYDFIAFDDDFVLNGGFPCFLSLLCFLIPPFEKGG